MFTGIVQAKGRVVEMSHVSGGARLIIDPGPWEHPVGAGESICVNGVCLTHAPADLDPSGTLAFDVVIETLNHTNLGGLDRSNWVNLEPSLTPSTPMGGHWVQGHVDGTGTISSLDKSDHDRRVTVNTESRLMPYIVPKGSITVDGISLTVAAVAPQENRFSVALIPTTVEQTTLGRLSVGDAVNIETDLVVKTVVHWLQNYGGGGRGH